MRRWLCLLAVCCAPTLAADPPPAALAWLRFDDASQSYAGLPYRWLGDGPLRVALDVAPAAGQALWLHWGAKGDERGAAVTLNGTRVPLARGGYDGWQWLSVPLPATLAGSSYELLLEPGAGKAAFLAELRLTGAGGTADVTARSHRARLDTARPSPFPEQQRLWDREPPPGGEWPDAAVWQQAERNGRRFNEMLYRCRRFVDGWMAQCDPQSGLFPRNLGESHDLWNAKDCAADNYPFMVLTCALTDRARFDGKMREILAAEQRLTNRVGRLPDDFLFSTQGFRTTAPVLDEIMFGASEYAKDGLLPLTEWLGPSPWSERLLGLLDECWQHAPVDTPYGKLPTLNFEVCGDQLQALSRAFWFTGDRKYLQWAERYGDYFLLGNHHPTRDLSELRLIDHGCEVVNGLSELYVAVSLADPPKQQAYARPIHAMFDRILEVGRDARGMLYASLNPQTGTHASGICDTWGYDYDGVYAVWRVDHTTAYREAVRHVLRSLPQVPLTTWGDADSWADSIEGAINLVNREPDAAAAAWIDAAIPHMWQHQRADGIVEGWHGDGNSARTAIMYALWQSQGFRLEPWRDDLRLGAVRDGERVLLSLAADGPWTGRLRADVPRHRLNLHLPYDYTRINQFPEWFTVEPTATWLLDDGAGCVVRGSELAAGWPVTLSGGEPRRLVLTRLDSR